MQKPVIKMLDDYGQSLVTKMVTQYLFIKGEFWQIHYWITFSSYILRTCKISRKLRLIAILSIKCLNCKFCSLELCIKYKLIDHIINNIRLIQNMTCLLRM